MVRLVISGAIGLVIVYATTAIPFCVWMLKGYFDTIPIDIEESALIESLEQEQKAIHDELADGSLYVNDVARASSLSERSAQIDNELTAALERWETLGGL